MIRRACDHRGFRPLAGAESWRVEVRLAAGDRWRPARLRLDDAGQVTLWTGRPFRRHDPGTVHAVYSESILARLILDRRGWPLVTAHERYRLGHQAAEQAS